MIIDASGIACIIGRKIGMDTLLKPRDVGICIQSRILSNFEEESIKIRYYKPFAPFGYSWIFPFSDELANIGIGIPGGQKIDLQKSLNEYISSVAEDYEIKSTFRACVPVPLKKLVAKNIMIVGDAARLALPLIGGGIGNALFLENWPGLSAPNTLEKKHL